MSLSTLSALGDRTELASNGTRHYQIYHTLYAEVSQNESRCRFRQLPIARDDPIDHTHSNDLGAWPRRRRSAPATEGRRLHRPRPASVASRRWRFTERRAAHETPFRRGLHSPVGG